MFAALIFLHNRGREYNGYSQESLLMSISTALYVKDDVSAGEGQLTTTSKFEALHCFPQALFFLTEDLKLISANKLGRKAMNSHLVRVVDKKLYFNSTESDALVQAVAQRLLMSDESSCNDGICSERIILRNVDGKYRSYTLSRESFDNSNLVLSIQNDLVLNDCRARALATAFSLSQAELKILKMMVNGLKPKQIAYEAGVSLNTVRSHLRTLYAKMQVNGYDEALTYAIKLLL